MKHSMAQRSYLTVFIQHNYFKKSTLASAWPALNNNVLHIFAAAFL